MEYVKFLALKQVEGKFPLSYIFLVLGKQWTSATLDADIQVISYVNFKPSSEKQS